ncbi:MAG: type II toxin-antitoxin system VapC family toxin, partial [Thermofilaceae archaeon]
LSELGEIGRVLTGIFSLAVSEGVTVYDASYIYAAETMGLVLVTDDSRLRSAAEKHVKTLTSAQLIV